jgi:hypothetical protein
MTRTIGWMITAVLLGTSGCSSDQRGGTAPVAATTPAAASGPLGSSWSDIARMPDFFTGVWQSSSPMTDGAVNVGYTQQAQAYIAKYKPKRDIQLAGADCKPAGLPITQRAGSPSKFMFEPGMILIYIEQASMARFIRLNAEHSEAIGPSFLGESVAHFEGDTLVVDTVGFRDDIVFQYGTKQVPRDPKAPPGPGPMNRAIFGPHGPNLRMVERMRLADKDTLEIKLTVYDDTVFTGPYESQPVQTFKRITGDAAWLGEWRCETAIANAYDPEKDSAKSVQPEETLKRLEGR